MATGGGSEPIGVDLAGNYPGFPNNFIIEVRHKFTSKIAGDSRSGRIDFGRVRGERGSGGKTIIFGDDNLL